MKRISIIALAAVCILAMGAGQVFADAFTVTSGFGIRVTEQGVSERVGPITIAPSEAGTDIFDPLPPQIITIELLGGATISRTFGAEYNWNGGDAVDVFDPTDPLDLPAGIGAYRVIAIEGNDYLEITILAAMIGGTDSVVLNHAEPDGVDDSALCFNLKGTIYNSVDPAQQLVQVSYNDSIGGTYSGDIYVATVKPKSILIEICDKNPPELELAFADQDESCGFGIDGSLCIKLTDTATGAFAGGQIYEFVLGRTDGAKVGVGFGDVTVSYYPSPAVFDPALPVGTGAALVQPGIPVKRLNRAGTALDPADYDLPADLNAFYSDTAQYTFRFTAQGPGLYVLHSTAGYDTCTASPGLWEVDLSGTKVPCGGSFSFTNLTVANWVSTTIGGQAQVFPYAVANVGGWFNGLVITNPNSSSITVTFAITEADGDVYTGSVTVAGNQMAVGLAENVMSPTTSGADAAFGDESYTITATAPLEFYSFLFIGDGTMAQGYLPINL